MSLSWHSLALLGSTVILEPIALAGRGWNMLIGWAWSRAEIFHSQRPRGSDFSKENHSAITRRREWILGWKKKSHYIWDAFPKYGYPDATQGHRIGVSVFFLVFVVKDRLSYVVKLCLLNLATVGTEPYHRQMILNYKWKTFSTFPNIALYMVVSLLVMHRTHALWEQIQCQDKCFLVPEYCFPGQDKFRKEQLSIMHWGSSLCFLGLLEFVFLVVFQTFFFSGSFVNRYFNVSFFHSLHSSVLHYYSFCCIRLLSI